MTLTDVPHGTGPRADDPRSGPEEAATRTWTGPAHIAPRGTLLVLAGRGESAEVYERLGARFAADGYRVVALGDDPGRTARATALLADDDLPAPHVVVGSDTGALAALELARSGARGLDAVVLAGLPTRDLPAGLSWDEELANRTACPNHRAVLGRAGRRTPAVAGPAPAVVLGGTGEPAAPRVAVPLLAVHGEADALSPAAEAVAAYRRLGAVQIAVVAGGLHDVLNDVTHRSVAATVVLFLERLRLGAELPVLVHDVATTVGGTGTRGPERRDA